MARLNRAKANPNSEALAGYIEKLLAQAKTRLWRAADACRDAGFEPAHRATRLGDEPPMEVVTTEWVAPDAEQVASDGPLDLELFDHLVLF